MTLLPLHSPPMEDVWVAIDLETTGLNSDREAIIEIGAVKFQGNTVLDTFQTFVNPGRKLTPFIKRFTGITQEQVDEAPPFDLVVGRLAAFLGNAPIIGHNVGFDMGFLEKAGLKLSNPLCDTWDMVYVLRPSMPEYSLSRLTDRMGLTHDRPHRAIDDALATKDVFLELLKDAARLDINSLAEMQRLADRSSWVLGYLLRGLGADVSGNGAGTRGIALSPGAGSGVGIGGLDTGGLEKRLKRERSLRPKSEIAKVDEDQVTSLFSEGSPLAEALPEFEYRPEQAEMAKAVARAINESQRLLVEAGTGVGKSLAYLLPAALYALANNKRVVVSTNTIALQEQLIGKDVPILVRALSAIDGLNAEELKFTQLKGRANYLCLRRWNHLRSSESINEDEARMLAKIMVWLRTTETGDRGELNLGGRNTAAPWDRLSAQGATDCLSSGGPCFLRASREKAAASHLVIVNHALLLSDLTAGGTLIPDYDLLIIDEAHHLEEEATRHLGFELSQARFDDHVQSLSGERGLLNEAINAFRTSTASAGRRESVEQQAAKITELLPRVRDNMAQLFAGIGAVMDAASEDGKGQEVRVTSGTRSQPAWSELEIQWQNADVLLAGLGTEIGRLTVSLEGLKEHNLFNYDGLLMEISNSLQTNSELRDKLKEFVPNPKSDGIYWARRTGRNQELTLYSAPLHVGDTLEEILFSKKDCVVLTSATLSTNGNFNHVVERTGFADAEELLLGSPFDYPNSALICVPQDMPEPNSWAYQEAVEQAVKDAAIAVDGHTMALFTSYAGLQATASAVREDLQSRGITVLAQGTDGSPQQLVRRFMENPKSVLIGTASFWEGVDLPGDALKVLLVTRLPFSVPSDPVFAARSELYENSFMDYAVPQAILRLRQGFGRLIRTKSDRGVAVLLDKRLVSRRYGKSFLKSLPPAKFVSCDLHELDGVIRDWMAK
ncbi:MAG: DEAD/DEAH box helicase family protein [Chloroflexi bacterium]|nr:DEAD/DEAH box helicase family protein [Chloroflexota bacterium]